MAFLGLSMIIAGGLIVDYATATPHWLAGKVLRKHCIPEWYESVNDYDSNGKFVGSHVNVHPAEYMAECSTEGRIGTVNISLMQFINVGEGQEVQIEFRSGHILNYGFTDIRPAQ